MSDTGIDIRPATVQDVWITAQVYGDMLPMGFFPALGDRFLRQWHRTVLAAPHGVLLVAVDTNGVYGGVLIGSTDHHTHTDALLRTWRSVLALAATGAVALLLRPALAVRFARSRALPWSRRILRAFRPVSDVVAEGAQKTAVLTGIAVLPAFRKRGVGRALVAEFLRQCRDDGAAAAELITDARNERAVHFYELLEWQLAGDYTTRDGDPIRLYRYTLNGDGGVPYREQR